MHACVGGSMGCVHACVEGCTGCVHACVVGQHGTCACTCCRASRACYCWWHGVGWGLRMSHGGVGLDNESWWGGA